MTCATCRADNPSGTRFCGQCGAPLRGETSEMPSAELRQLTVVFCDLVGSTALAAALDPEDLRDVTSAYHSACESVIRRHEGTIAQFLGDGVLVYFGHPIAHEDDARRAVRTALEIVGELALLSSRFQRERGFALNARLGIHTGPVVVGEVGGGDRREQLALGKTPNVAARIQSLAEPGTVVVSEETHRLVRGFFEFAALGAHEVKGLAESVTLYRVLHESGADSRLDVARRAGMTALTGRDRELRLLEERWRAATASNGHAVLLQGEPGIGKSRIVDSLRERVERDSATVLECVCTPYAQNTALFPIASLIESTLGFTRETPGAEKRRLLEARLTRRGVFSEERLALMGQLLAIPLAGPDPVAGYSAQKRRERTLEVLHEWLIATSRAEPVLWVVEDLHWADPTTLEFVSSVIGALAGERLLVLLTFRPDFAAPWRANGCVSSMLLTRLDAAETGSLASRVARGKALPPEVLRQLVARTEGVPLFVEEVTKAVLELGVLVEREDHYELAGPLPPDLIPATVQGSLNARLDRLGPAKAVAQLAASIGREFRYDLLESVAADSGAALRDGLDRLLKAELVYRRDDVPEETYLFKHALIQDAAYSSLLKKTRREQHRRIADALTTRFVEVVNTRPELVAEHRTGAGQADEAVTFWSLAAKLALERAAYHEAIGHLTRGLSLVPELPETGRLERELELNVGLIPALIAVDGWGSDRLARVYARAGALLDLIGETPFRFVVLSGNIGYHLLTGQIAKALALAEQMVELAAKGNDAFLWQVAFQVHSCSLMFHGALRRSVELSERALAQYDEARDRATAQPLGVSSYVSFLCYEMEALALLGHLDQSMRAIDRAIELARHLGHVPSLAMALSNKVSVLCLRREASSALQLGDEVIQLAREEQLGLWEPIQNIYRGWAMTALGRTAEGIGEMREGFARYRAEGNGLKQLQFLGLIAGALWDAGHHEEALALIAEGMSLADAHGEGYLKSELYRLKGEFLMSDSAAETASWRSRPRVERLVVAEESLDTALSIARAQEARLLELRALTSLLRLRRTMGRDDASARESLAAVYATFTEGLDLPDVCEARELLGAAR